MNLIEQGIKKSQITIKFIPIAQKYVKGYEITLYINVDTKGEVSYIVTCLEWCNKKKHFEECESSFPDIESAIECFKEYK